MQTILFKHYNNGKNTLQMHVFDANLHNNSNNSSIIMKRNSRNGNFNIVAYKQFMDV